MDLNTIEQEALAELQNSNSLPEIESLYTRYLGRKEGHLTQILRNLGQLPPDQRKDIGRQANVLRQKLESEFSSRQNEIKQRALAENLKNQSVDLTLPGKSFSVGHPHPIRQAIDELTEIFRSIGFDSVTGPEIESDFNNFTALNIPENHPARDLQDTFYTKLSEDPTKPQFGNLLLRTHTSPVQIRLMKSVKPPVRIIAPGRVYRHEAIDATHAAVFHQVEGLAIDTDISFADLKGTLEYALRKFFGSETKIRFRPGYFPFVEPGAEVDVLFSKKGPGHDPEWLEMLGAGMVHPQVLRNVGYDPKKYTGFAFGIGIERLVMVRHQVKDIRHFLESDLRFLEQFNAQ